MDLQELLAKLWEEPSNKNLAAVLSHPDCTMKLQDGSELSRDFIKKYAGEDGQHLMDYLQNSFLSEDLNGVGHLIVADKSHPDYRRQLIPFNAAGVLYDKDHFMIPVENVASSENDGKAKDGIFSAKDYLEKFPSPESKELAALKEPTKPTWGSYIKEWLSPITGGSKTLREYRKYEKQKAAAESRVYDHLKKMGFEAEKPKSYVRAPKKQAPDRNQEFAAFSIAELNQKNLQKSKSSAGRDNIRTKQKEKLMNQMKLLSGDLTTRRYDFTEPLLHAMETNAIKDETLTLLTQIKPEQFVELCESFKASTVKRDEVMGWLDGVATSKRERTNNTEKVSSLLKTLQENKSASKEQLDISNH